MPIPTRIASTSRRAAARFRRGQALIEATVGIILFTFLGIMGYEVAILQHNLTLVQEATREACWAAARGANDAEVQEMLAEAGTRLITGAFMAHAAFSFGIEVWTDTHGAASLPWASAIGPDPGDPTELSLSPGDPSRAPNVYRAQGYSLRLGVAYTISVGAPFFGAFKTFTVRAPIAASEPIVVRNDEDRDGLADLYEPEVIARRGLMQGTPGVPPTSIRWPALVAGDTYMWYPYSHTDSGAYLVGILTALSDAENDDIDGDGTVSETAVDIFEIYDYDFDNDGVMDKFDFQANNGAARPQRLIHPVFGGNAL